MLRLPRLAGLFLSLTAGSAAFGEAAPFHAGVVRLPIGGEKPFGALVWYPTAAPEGLWRTGPFAIPASRDAAIASGRFPVVLLSHGGGPGWGSPLILTELSSRTSAGRRCDRPHRTYAGIRRMSIAPPSTRRSRAKS
nr:hypothetical protein [uncultured Rhodopila sp.]